MSKSSVVIRMAVETSSGAEELEFKGKDVISASLVDEVNPPSLELPISEVEFQFYSTDARFSLFSIGEFEHAFTQGQKVSVHGVFGGEERHLGDYFLEEWSTPREYIYKFRCVDIIGVLDKITYDGGFWTSLTDAQTVLSSILSEHNISFTISAALTNKSVKGWIKPGTVREAIHQVAFAIGATVTSTPTGGLHFSAITLPINDAPSGLTILRQQKLNRQNVNRLQQTTSIELISHEYTKQPDTKVEIIYDAVLAPGDYKVVFEKPYYDISVEGVGFIAINLATEYGDNLITEGGDELVIDGGYVFGSNYLYLTVAAPGGQVVVSGYPWVDSMRSHLHTEANIVSGKNAIKIDSATLVSLDNAEILLSMLRDYHRQRFVQEATIIKKKEALGGVEQVKYGAQAYGTFRYGNTIQVYAPLHALAVNDCVTVETIDNHKIKGVIEMLETDLTGGMITKLIARGIEVN